MVERFERLRSLSPEEQQRAFRRARRLSDELDATEKALGPEQRGPQLVLGPVVGADAMDPQALGWQVAADKDVPGGVFQR